MIYNFSRGSVFRGNVSLTSFGFDPNKAKYIKYALCLTAIVLNIIVFYILAFIEEKVSDCSFNKQKIVYLLDNE